MKRRVIEQYEFLRKLGSGGSGVVFLANDTLLQRPVVLKLLKRGTQTAEQVRATQLREARLASAIDHPNVCAIYEVGETDGEAFIVMQYIPGKSLDKVIAEGPANVQLVLSSGMQIADGLAAAHHLGIFHRDLKPANVMLTDGGLIKILDFGLARQLKSGDMDFDPSIPVQPTSPALAGATYTARGGTIAYMAPEQFVTGQSSVQSDLFALGLILYEMVSGRHPFHRPDAQEVQSIRAIQFAVPPPLRDIVPAIPSELESVILRCLEKQPAERFASAAEVREALKTIVKSLQLDSVVMMPGEGAGHMLEQQRLDLETPEQEKRTTGILSMLAERFRETPASPANKGTTLVVLPFVNLGASAGIPNGAAAPFYGAALADALAARLAKLPSLVVRPSSALMNVHTGQLDPLALGRKLLVDFVLAGSFLRSESGFDLNWQLLDVAGQSVRTGGSISVETFDLVSVQTEICDEVFAELRGTGDLKPAPGTEGGSKTLLGDEVSEEYLQARALLSSFVSRTGNRDELDHARELFEAVVTRHSGYAPGWSGLGITHLQYARHGMGGQMHVLEARRAFDRALERDPQSVEANLYRVYMLLSRGEKEAARHGIEHLLQGAPNDWNVHLVAGITLRNDGLYEIALEQFHTSLRLNPSNAAMIYNHRARVYQYQNQLQLAREEIEKGLTLEPRQPLLRISLGYQQMREGQLSEAVDTLERVIRDDSSLRIVFPTIAMCYVQLGERLRAAGFIQEEVLAAAEADNEMAYRLATYFAVEDDTSEALHWLRRAIYLGNENYPWFSINPAWKGMSDNGDFQRILEDLKKTFRRNEKTWRRLLA